MSLNPKVWGPHAWFFLETVAMAYPIDPTNEDKQLYKLHVNDILIINCNSRDIQCRISAKSGSKKKVTVILNSPICAKIEDKIAISKKVSSSPKLIGQGTIKGGTESILLG